MSNISIERLEEFIRSPLENGLTRGEQMEISRELLEYRKAGKEPVGWMTDIEIDELHLGIAEEAYIYRNSDITSTTPLYAVPQLQQFNVPDEQTWEELCMQNPEFTIGDAIIRAAAWNACREAMINMMRKVS